MSRPRWMLLGPWVALSVALMGACAETSAPPPSSDPIADFSGARALAHLEQLVAIGPRVSGGDGAAAARRYLRAELERIGAEVTEQSASGEGSGVYRNLVGALPGSSEDLVVLAAPYDSQPFEGRHFVGANQGASGAALLLELGRVLAARPLPFRVWLAFVDGDAPRTPEGDPYAAFHGTRLLVQELDGAGQLARIRLAVYFDRVADRELRIARDLHSHRQYRSAFFEAAHRLGHGGAFPGEASPSGLAAGHIAFWAAGMRSVVAVMDDRPAEDDDLARCSAESLAAVGEVAETALHDITRRLAKIDRFTRRPEPPVPPLAVGAEAAEPELPVPEAAVDRQSQGETPEEPGGSAALAVGAPSDPEGFAPAARPGERIPFP